MQAEASGSSQPPSSVRTAEQGHAVASLALGQGAADLRCRATFRAEMRSGIRARKGTGSGPVAAAVLGPFYAQAPPPALHTTSFFMTGQSHARTCATTA